MNKDNILYKAMKKYRRKFLFINIISLCLLMLFIILKYPYLRTEMRGASELDIDRLLSETDVFVIDELIELDRHESKSPETIFGRSTSYWQDDRYLFEIKADTIEDTGIVYTEKISMSQGKPIEYESARVYLAKCAGRSFAVIAPPGAELTSPVTGFLVDRSNVVVSDLSKLLEDGESLTLSEYFIDARDLEMGTSSSDLFIARIWLIIMLLLFIKLAVYYFRPELTPTYRQLRRYGPVLQVADEVCLQAQSDDAVTDGGQIITKDFILSDSSFKKTVAKNHMSKH